MIEACHTFNVSGRCPVNGDVDQYEVRVTVARERLDRMPLVEDVLAVAEQFLREPVLQEKFTRDLAYRLKAEVETVCAHRSVSTRCTVRQPKQGWPHGVAKTEAERAQHQQACVAAAKNVRQLSPKQREVYRMVRAKRIPAVEAMEMAKGSPK